MKQEEKVIEHKEVPRNNPQLWRIAEYLESISGSAHLEVRSWDRAVFNRYQLRNQEYWYDKAVELIKKFENKEFVGEDIDIA